ncbi:MAG TPA: Uma2 family endonuclease [Pirellulales bacterium]
MNLDPDFAQDMHLSVPSGEAFVYPESDGLPLSESTRQFAMIFLVVGGLDAQFRDRDDVFVAGDLLWYPRYRDAKTRAAPDAMVVFGRPKHHRGSYAQAEENNIAPQVVFEILSPNNTALEMDYKLDFYNEYGAEEFYILDPQSGDMRGWVRGESGQLEPVRSMQNWVSPRLGVRFFSKFDDSDDNIKLYHPDGSPFETFVEVERRAALAEERSRRDEAARLAAEEAARRAETARLAAEEQTRRDQERIARLMEQLRQAGLDPRDEQTGG